MSRGILSWGILSYSRPDCTLQHHPEPCDWVDDRRPNVVCTHYAHDEVLNEEGINTHGEVEPIDPGAALQLLENRLAQLQREKEEEARRANQLQIANQNLLSSQSRLMEQNQVLQNSPYFRSSVSTTTTTTDVLSAPVMGTGYSVAGVAPVLSTGMYLPRSTSAKNVAGTFSSGSSQQSGAAGISSFESSSLASAANALASRNTATSAAPQRSIPGYRGPSLPELRQQPRLSNLTEQVMSLLMREVPSLAPAPSSEPVVQPVPGGLPAGVLPGVPPGVLPQAPHHQPLFPPMQRQGVATGAASQLPSSSLPLFGGSSYSHHPPADPALQQLDLLQRQLDELRHGRQLPQESFL